jgi:hypothetical protein
VVRHQGCRARRRALPEGICSLGRRRASRHRPPAPQHLHLQLQVLPHRCRPRRRAQLRRARSTITIVGSKGAGTRAAATTVTRAAGPAAGIRERVVAGETRGAFATATVMPPLAAAAAAAEIRATEIHGIVTAEIIVIVAVIVMVVVADMEELKDSSATVVVIGRPTGGDHGTIGAAAMRRQWIIGEGLMTTGGQQGIRIGVG